MTGFPRMALPDRGGRDPITVGHVSYVPVPSAASGVSSLVAHVAPRLRLLPPDTVCPPGNPRESAFHQAECESRSDIAYDLEVRDIDDRGRVPMPQTCSQHWGEASAEPRARGRVGWRERLGMSFALPRTDTPP